MDVLIDLIEMKNYSHGQLHHCLEIKASMGINLIDLQYKDVKGPGYIVQLSVDL